MARPIMVLLAWLLQRGPRMIWRINIDGTDLVQLTHLDQDRNPFWSQCLPSATSSTTW